MQVHYNNLDCCLPHLAHGASLLGLNLNRDHSTLPCILSLISGFQGQKIKNLKIQLVEN